MALEDHSPIAPQDTRAEFAVEIDPPIASPVLARLLKEVRGGDHEVAHGYNRTYNRHSR